MRPTFFVVAIALCAALSACPGSNPVCDSAGKLNLAAKAGDCTGLDTTSPFGDTTSCNAKIHGCTADDQQTLTAAISCLEMLPTCAKATQASWVTQQQTCIGSTASLTATCQEQFFPSSTGGGAGGGSGGGSATGGGGNSTPDAGRDTLPCDVAGVIGTYCGKCHGPQPLNAAPYPLVKRSDFFRQSPTDLTTTVGARCVVRLGSADQPMPPDPEPKPTMAEAKIVTDWVAAGMNDGTCTPDAGAIDAGPAPVSCLGTQMGMSTVASENMDPGWACQSCHLGHNFQNQNPNGYAEPFRAYFFMGTAFPDFHEADLCLDVNPGNVTIQIYDAMGTQQYEFTPSTAGNFYSVSKNADIALPYTASITGPTGKKRWMLTAQAIGDCNTCHTEQGLNGAPGRIVYPQ